MERKMRPNLSLYLKMELVRGTIIVIEVFSMLDYIPLGNIVEVAIEIVQSFISHCISLIFLIYYAQEIGFYINTRHTRCILISGQPWLYIY